MFRKQDFNRGRAPLIPWTTGGAQAADARSQTLRRGPKLAVGRHVDAELELGWKADPRGDTRNGLILDGTVRF